MAIIKTMPSQAVIDSLRGKLDFYQWCSLNIVRSWPKYHITERSPAVQAAQIPFAYISRVATDLPPEIVDSWKYLASQSNLTWRDWLIRAYVGGTLTAPGQPPL